MKTTEQPRFSVVMTVYDNGRELEQTLPAYLEQDYEPGYEVIVVDESSTDDTDDVLTLLKAKYPHLYTTFLPKPDRNVTRQRLALTLGVKAAKSDWLVFTDIHTLPPSDQWLKELAQFAGDSQTALLLGYIQRKDGTVRLQLFDQPKQARTLVSKAERRRANGHRGRWLRYLRGKYDFLAVRTELGHDALRLYEQDIRGLQLLSMRFKTLLHNLTH